MRTTQGSTRTYTLFPDKKLFRARGHAVRPVRPGDVVAAPQTAARRRCGAARETWDRLQQEVLEALGHTVYRATGPGLAPLSDDPLLHALLRAAGRDEIGRAHV